MNSVTWWKEFAGTVESLGTVIALAVAGFWTWQLFVTKRERFPRAVVTHKIVQKCLGEAAVLIHVAAHVKNIGRVLLSLTSAQMRLYLVVPLDEGQLERAQRETDTAHEIDLPCLREHRWDWTPGAAEIEPGETEILHADFVVDPKVVRTFQVYTHVVNPRKSPVPTGVLGWTRTTFEDVIRCSQKQEIT